MTQITVKQGKLCGKRVICIAMVCICAAIAFAVFIHKQQKFHHLIEENSDRFLAYSQFIWHTTSKICATRWPKLELFLSLGTSRLDEYHLNLYPTLMFFWPLHRLDIVIVVDAELPNLENFVGKLKKDMKSANSLKVMTNTPNKFYGNAGWYRQQLIMFYADNFTSAEYVGFIDSDTMFISSPDESDLFENGKPIFIGKYGTPGPMEGGPNGDWARAPIMTRWALGKDEVLKSMSHFPVIIKLSHLVELRHFMVKYHNATSFNEVFDKMMKTKQYFAQFNIMCTYIYHFHRNEYVWRVQVVSGGWNGRAPFGKVKSLKEANVSEVEQQPFPRICIHGNGHHLMRGWTTDDMMRAGYCWSNLKSTTTKMPSLCKRYSKDLLMTHMFSFECEDWTWHPMCKAKFDNRQARQKHLDCSHKWDKVTLAKLGLA